MSSTAGRGELRSPRDNKLGLSEGLVVQELGWDEDVDDDVRVQFEDATDTELVEEAVEAVDVVLLWWREGDGDLVDGLVDALTDLTESGYIWLLTPKFGRPGYVDAAELAEGAVTAGLSLTNGASISRRLGGQQAGPAEGPAPLILPEIGTRAPDFTAVNQHGQAISLSALRGAPVVVFFYPFAFSRVCTNELRALRDWYDGFQQAGAKVLAVSTDTIFTLRAFDEQEGLEFDLLSDHWPHGAIASSYGVFDSVLGCALRGSFVLDSEG